MVNTVFIPILEAVGIEKEKLSVLLYCEVICRMSPTQVKPEVVQHSNMPCNLVVQFPFNIRNIACPHDLRI